MVSLTSLCERLDEHQATDESNRETTVTQDDFETNESHPTLIAVKHQRLPHVMHLSSGTPTTNRNTSVVCASGLGLVWPW